MRPAILICLFVIFGYTTNAQFTILPQVGFENSKTSVEQNELSSFSPAGAKLSPQAGIRLNYLFKQRHGPYVGIATSRSVVRMQFTDPEAAVNNYTASQGETQLRLEGGYQVSTKPIYFKRSAATAKPSGARYHTKVATGKCGKYMARSGCGNKMNKAVASRAPASSPDKGAWVRIQPSLGMAYLPSIPTSQIISKSQGSQTVYQYNAGNWNTAMVGGVGFEFGSGNKRSFIVSINYVKGLGNPESSVTTLSGNKPTVTSFESHSSSWNLRMGVPISFTKKKADIKQILPNQKISKVQKKYGPGLYKYQKRCTKRI